MAWEREVIGDCTLYQGDAADIVPTLGLMDVLLTDPPYGIGGDVPIAPTKPSRPSTWAKRQKYASLGWDRKPSRSLLLACLRVSRYQIIWGGNYFADCLPPSRGWLFWDKQFEHTTNFSHGELAWTSLDHPLRKFTLSSKAETMGGQTREHPTQKPVGLMRWCLAQVPMQCQVVCDPFMGSGSTGVATVELGKVFIGIEREPRYFAIACRRLEAATRQLNLFPRHPLPSFCDGQQRLFA